MELTDWEATEKGTPQGGVISPLLANIYLDALDWKMQSLGFEMVRYADDMVVLCRTKEEAQTALERLREWMEEAELTLHPDKTKLTDMSEPRAMFEFLGYRFERSRKGRLNRFIRKKSLLKLRDSIRYKTPRNNGHSMETIIKRVNVTLQGTYGYFKHVHPSQLEEIDRWVRGRLRAIKRKRRGLRGRGRGTDHQRWPNRYFSELGFFSLLEAKNAELLSLRNGANS